jgi:uncharacterized membrane protein
MHNNSPREPAMFEQIDLIVLEWISAAALVIEVLAVAIIIVAIFGGLFQYLKHMFISHRALDERFNAYRQTLGRALLLGLEILVAADVIKTVALDTTIESVLVLGILVMIRIFLGWSLIVELEGRWPWQPKPEEEDGKGASGDA